MALAYERAPGGYSTMVASRVGTAQKGEAMTLVRCVCRLAQHEGVYSVVPDSKSAVGTLHTNHQESGHFWDGIHHACAHTL